MDIRPDHELHRRRLSRNVGVGLALLAFVALVYGLTVAKTLERGVEALPHAEGDG